jgi:hypothetical protein
MKLNRILNGILSTSLCSLAGCDLLKSSYSTAADSAGSDCPVHVDSNQTLRLIQDDLNNGSTGVLNFAYGMIDQLHEELLKTNTAQVAAALSNSARNEVEVAIGSLVIPVDAKVEPLSLVSGPMLRGGVLGLNDPCSESGMTENRLSLASNIVSASTSTLNGRTSGLSSEETAKIIGAMTTEAVKALPDVELAGKNATVSVPEITHAAVAALPSAGIPNSVMIKSLQEISSSATAALSADGFEQIDILELSSEVTGSAISGLKDAGFTPEQIIESGAINLIISGSIAGIQQASPELTNLMDALSSVAGGAVKALADAGFGTPEFKKSALSAVIESSVAQSLLLSDGSSEFMALALSEIASEVVASLNEGGFESEEIDSAISVIVETGVTQLASSGVSSAAALTEISSKLISGALEGVGKLLNSGSIDAGQAADSAKGASNGAVQGLSSLQEAGVISAESVDSFKEEVSKSISSGLESSGVSAEVIAQAQESVQEVLPASSTTTPVVTTTTLAIPTVASPTFSATNDSTYTTPLSLSISTETAGATIRYSLDGSVPSINSGTLYTGAITLRSNKTVKAIAYKDGSNPSQVATISYAVSLPLFGTATSFTTGNDPNGVAAGDLNGDGKVDLAVALYAGKGVSLLRGNGDGSFNAKQDISNPATTAAGASTGPNFWSGMIAMADLSNDGKPDLAWGAWGFNGASIALNSTATNSETFSIVNDVPWVHDVGLSGPRGAAIGDADMDGDPDVFISEHNSGRRVALYKNNGSGTFTKHTSDLWISNNTLFGDNLSPYMVALGDFNGDNKPDVAAGGESGGRLGVLVNGTSSAGTPVFNTASPNSNAFLTSSTTGCTNHKYISINDVTADGKVDIIATCKTDAIAIFANTTAANASSASFDISSFAATSGLVSLATGDVDGDSKIDIVAANSTNIDWYKGNGDGSFATPVSYAMSATSSDKTQIILADVNGDSRLDAIVTNTDSKVTVLLNQSAQ